MDLPHFSVQVRFEDRPRGLEMERCGLTHPVGRNTVTGSGFLYLPFCFAPGLLRQHDGRHPSRGGGNTDPAPFRFENLPVHFCLISSNNTYCRRTRVMVVGKAVKPTAAPISFSAGSKESPALPSAGGHGPSRSRPR